MTVLGRSLAAAVCGVLVVPMVTGGVVAAGPVGASSGSDAALVVVDGARTGVVVRGATVKDAAPLVDGLPFAALPGEVSSGEDLPLAEPVAVDARTLSPVRPGGAGMPMPVGTVRLSAVGVQDVFVQLAPDGDGEGTAAVFEQVYDATFEGELVAQQEQYPHRSRSAHRRAATVAASEHARSRAAARKARVERVADRVADVAKRGGAQVLFTVSNTLPGVALRADEAVIADLESRPEVVSISTIPQVEPTNASGVQLTRAVAAWQDAGLLGEDMSIAVIDSGIDYTHADFGGSGNPADYATARGTADDQDSTWWDDLPDLAKAKIAGGWDFVGDDYDPTTPIVPDPDPLDCDGHGTHISGTAAGYGVNGDGSTFTGDYHGLDAAALEAMRIGPGTAPKATIWAFKVFGCATAVGKGWGGAVVQALDRTLDPNDDGDFSDKVDVVNMSLGGFADPSDPIGVMVGRIAELGLLTTIAMGNEGDVTDTGRSPGTSVRGLGVASSVDTYQLLSTVEIVAPPAGVPSSVVVQRAEDFDWDSFAGLEADVVVPTQVDNATGCTVYDGSDEVAGKIVWLEWSADPGARGCPDKHRDRFAFFAGAAGVILAGTQPVPAGTALSFSYLPMVQLAGPQAEVLRPAAEAGTLTVSFPAGMPADQVLWDHRADDVLSIFSSRGPHGSVGVVKPDVAAPGDSIASASVGTGSGSWTASGTSTSAPHVAGIAALVRQRHPDWSVEQVKAAVMNTASHDVYTDAAHSRIFGPARVGSGRVDGLDAVTTTVLAYNADGSGAISASFGVVEVPTGTTVTRSIDVTVENTGSAPRTVDVGYQHAVTQPGVTYAVSPRSMTIPAHGTATITVTMTAIADQLRHTIDPTMARTVDFNIPRPYVSDASGWVTIDTGEIPRALRVPVFTAAKPVSTVTAKPGAHSGGDAVVFDGAGFDQGDTGNPEAWSSKAAVMDLGVQRPAIPLCADNPRPDCLPTRALAAVTVRYAGAGAFPASNGSNADGWLYFGIATQHDWGTLGITNGLSVEIDVDGDDIGDYWVVAERDGVQFELVWSDLWTADGDLLYMEPVNGYFGDIDTNLFDSNTVILPTWPALIGLTDDDTSFPIRYRVYGISADYDVGAFIADETDWVDFDVVNPTVRAEQLLFEVPGPSAIPVTVAPKPATALVFTLHNTSGTRAQTVTFPKPSHHTDPPPTGPPPAEPSECVSGFPDVPASSVFCSDIAWLAAQHITTGYMDGTFQPARPISRQAMAALLYRFAGSPPWIPPETSPFTDVAPGDVFYNEVTWLAHTGVSRGYTDSTYRPETPVSRQAMAAFLHRLTEPVDTAQTCTAAPYTDISATHQFCPDITWLTDTGIAQGYIDGTYRPETPVSRQAMAAFLHRLAA